MSGLWPRGILLAAALLAAGGCNSNGHFLTEDRMENGLVIILPGIEGESELNRNIRRGLIAGGVYRALPIHNWGRPIPIAGVLVNQVDFLGNRLAGAAVANMIENYQDSHPGKPVHVVGHSGGGGVAVFTAEALGEGRTIDGLVLLSASISSAYNLTKAASRCRNGIVNFYNPDDAGLLGIGTTVMGTVDGTHGPSAGLLGFDRAGKAGHENVYQIKLSGFQSGDDPHASTTRVGFVSAHVAPWILSERWPVGASMAVRADPRPLPPDEVAEAEHRQEADAEKEPKAAAEEEPEHPTADGKTEAASDEEHEPPAKAGKKPKPPADRREPAPKGT
jgi:pimeloyl-ACP methyl ester carboxylesterase